MYTDVFIVASSGISSNGSVKHKLDEDQTDNFQNTMAFFKRLMVSDFEKEDYETANRAGCSWWRIQSAR